jgi:CheY-like chemotaxis protein
MDNPAPTTPATVLFVDDDASFLETVQGALAPLTGDQWKILLATDAQQALSEIRAQPVHLAVLDVHMPGMGGLQLLQILKRDFAALPKVLFTSAPDAATRQAGLEAGAALFLEKPGSLAGMESLFATLNELVKWHRKQDPTRPPRQAGLLEMVRLECASGNSRLIEVTTPDSSGLVFIKNGSILHAEAPGRRGQSAFTFLASHPAAGFVLKEFTDPPERSVTRQWEFLVLEAFQLREQLTQAAQEAKRKETKAPARPASTPEPPGAVSHALRDIAAATPARKPTAPTFTPPPQKLRLAPAGPRSPDRSPPATAVSTASVEAVQPLNLEPVPATLSLGVSKGKNSPHIEEMLVCSHQNEVLYDWRCAQTEVRFRLFDAIRTKTEQITQVLPIGHTSRIEFQANEGRVVVRCHTEAMLLIRSNHKERPCASTVPPFNSTSAEWLADHSEIRGLRACGIMHANRTLMSCSYDTKLPAEGLNTLWRGIHEIKDLVREQNLDCWLVRWIFGTAQLYWIRRLDGRSLGLLLATEPTGLDVSNIQKMTLEFSSLLEA